MTRRRALRGPGAPAGGRGRTETPPPQNSQRVPGCHAHGALRGRIPQCAAWHRAKFARRITHGHYARVVHTATGHAHYAPNIRTAHYPGGAMGTSRPTAITPGHATRKIRGTITHAKFARAPWRAHRPCPVVRSRCGRARCPHRAAAPDGAVRGVASREIRQRCKACRGTRPLRTRIAQAKFACGVRAAITRGARGARRGAKRARLRRGNSRFRWRK